MKQVAKKSRRTNASISESKELQPLAINMPNLFQRACIISSCDAQKCDDFDVFQNAAALLVIHLFVLLLFEERALLTDRAAAVGLPLRTFLHFNDVQTQFACWLSSFGS